VANEKQTRVKRAVVLRMRTPVRLKSTFVRVPWLFASIHCTMPVFSVRIAMHCTSYRKWV